MRILGVDPGSRLTGYGCIDAVGRQIRHIGHGTLKLANVNGKAVIPLEDRLYSIFTGLSEVIQKFKPEIMVVEKVFFAKNALSALKLGQARGVVLLSGRFHSLKIFEYSPTEVKSTVTGFGHADKEQVAKMVERVVGKHQFTSWDASDGLALAICHALFAQAGSSQQLNVKLELQRISGKRKRKKMSLAEAVGARLPASLQKKV